MLDGGQLLWRRPREEVWSWVQIPDGLLVAGQLADQLAPHGYTSLLHRRCGSPRTSRLRTTSFMSGAHGARAVCGTSPGTGPVVPALRAASGSFVRSPYAPGAARCTALRAQRALDEPRREPLALPPPPQ